MCVFAIPIDSEADCELLKMGFGVLRKTGDEKSNEITSILGI